MSFEEHRPMLFGIAYRMLGSAMEAEDMVQESYLRFQAVDAESIRSEKAFLSAVVTRLCLDHLKSAKVKREEYIGPWLPEPILTDDSVAVSPAQRMSDLESISMAFLVILENLSPLERAVFLLREVFDYNYSEIARMLEKEEAACRKLFSRAKQHITANRPRYAVSTEAHQAILSKFLMAVQAGDLAGLTSLLAEDVTSWSDGGGQVSASIRPVSGRGRVATLYLGIVKRVSKKDITTEILLINGKPSLFIRWADGRPLSVLMIDTDGTHITAIRQVLNPDKLRHLQ